MLSSSATTQPTESTIDTWQQLLTTNEIGSTIYSYFDNPTISSYLKVSKSLNNFCKNKLKTQHSEYVENFIDLETKKAKKDKLSFWVVEDLKNFPDSYKANMEKAEAIINQRATPAETKAVQEELHNEFKKLKTMHSASKYSSYCMLLGSIPFFTEVGLVCKDKQPDDLGCELSILLALPVGITLFIFGCYFMRLSGLFKSASDRAKNVSTSINSLFRPESKHNENKSTATDIETGFAYQALPEETLDIESLKKLCEQTNIIIEDDKNSNTFIFSLGLKDKFSKKEYLCLQFNKLFTLNNHKAVATASKRSGNITIDGITLLELKEIINNFKLINQGPQQPSPL